MQLGRVIFEVETAYPKTKEVRAEFASALTFGSKRHFF